MTKPEFRGWVICRLEPVRAIRAPALTNHGYWVPLRVIVLGVPGGFSRQLHVAPWPLVQPSTFAAGLKDPLLLRDRLEQSLTMNVTYVQPTSNTPFRIILLVFNH